MNYTILSNEYRMLLSSNINGQKRYKFARFIGSGELFIIVGVKK